MVTVDKAPPGVALGELKAHLRIEDSFEDGLLAGWVLAATEAVEAELGQLLIERDVVETGRASGGGMRLTQGPVRALVDLQQRLAGGDWVAVEAGRAIFTGGSRAWAGLPGVADGTELRVRYRAGIAAGWPALPELLRHAVVRLSAHFQAHRDSAEAPGVPRAVRQLLATQRARRLL